jgi:toxin-antitoxin system PIN domain toxin
MHLPDINVWLALAFEVHFHHKTAKLWFEKTGPDSCAFCRLTQQGFLRLATNPAFLKNEAITMDAAWSCYDRLLEDERVYFIREPKGLDEAWKKNTRNKGYSHRVWNDAYLAAVAQTANLKIATFDQGFRKYKETKLTILS